MLDPWALVAPLSCVVCGAPARPPGLCVPCADEVPDRVGRLARCPEGIDEAWALGPYASPVGALVRRAKYREDAGAARWLAARAVGGLAALPVGMITAVPPFWWKRLVRDVDVPAQLASSLSKAWSVPSGVVLRRGRAGALAGRAHRERAAAARGVWRATAPVEGRVLLVDDVLTTGTTAAACARELRGAGATSVSLVVFGAAAVWSHKSDNVRK